MSIVRIRPATSDTSYKYGDPAGHLRGPDGHTIRNPDGAAIQSENPDRVELPGAFTAPRTSTDLNDRGSSGVTVGLTLFADFDADLAADDLVEVDGAVYRIDGEIAAWKHPHTGWEAGVTAALVAARG